MPAVVTAERGSAADDGADGSSFSSRATTSTTMPSVRAFEVVKRDTRANMAGFTRTSVWEFSCRTASTWVYGQPKKQTWVRDLFCGFSARVMLLLT